MARTTAAALVSIVVAFAGSAAATQRDSNFGCDLSGQRLWPLKPSGYTIPRGVSASLRLWKPNASSEAAIPQCSRLPPTRFIVGAPGQGRVSSFDLVVVTKDVKIHRAFTKSLFACGDKNPARRFGAWWTFDAPRHKATLRSRNAICAEWNDLSMKVECILRAGTVVAIGRTEAANCKASLPVGCAEWPKRWPDAFPATDQHQVFLNLFSRSPAEISKFLTNCQTYTWRGRE